MVPENSIIKEIDARIAANLDLITFAMNMTRQINLRGQLARNPLEGERTREVYDRTKRALSEMPVCNFATSAEVDDLLQDLGLVVYPGYVSAGMVDSAPEDHYFFMDDYRRGDSSLVVCFTAGQWIRSGLVPMTKGSRSLELQRRAPDLVRSFGSEVTALRGPRGSVRSRLGLDYYARIESCSEK